MLSVEEVLHCMDMPNYYMNILEKNQKLIKEFCEYVGNKKETDLAYLHFIRSGYFNYEKEEKLLGFKPKYTNVEAILDAVKSYVNRGIIKINN